MTTKATKKKPAKTTGPDLVSMVNQLDLFASKSTKKRARATTDARAKKLRLDEIPVRTNGTATSAAAADATRRKSATHSLLILELIIKHGGLTADEVDEMTGLGHATASARVNGLMGAGRIVNSGVKRKTRKGCAATVWKVAASAAAKATST